MLRIKKEFYVFVKHLSTVWTVLVYLTYNLQASIFPKPWQIVTSFLSSDPLPNKLSFVLSMLGNSASSFNAKFFASIFSSGITSPFFVTTTLSIYVENFTLAKLRGTAHLMSLKWQQCQRSHSQLFHLIPLHSIQISLPALSLSFSFPHLHLSGPIPSFNYPVL